jgi:cysteine-S-conjugate beta-lyase
MLSPIHHTPIHSQPEFRPLNPAVHRASTLTFANAEDFLKRKERLFNGYSYGLYGTPTTRELEQQVAAIEGGQYCCAVSSGLAAVTQPLLSLLRQGDHILVADCVYGPTREFCRDALLAYGVECTFIPADAISIEPWLQPNTRLIVLESPGSYTMELQDTAAICQQAHAQGAIVMMDNAWGFGLAPWFEHGVDIVCSALSKYASGHSDVCMGSITVRSEDLFKKIKARLALTGLGVSSDDAYLVLRGLQTLDVRLAEHYRRGLTVAAWLQSQAAVAKVLYPPADDVRINPLYQRYFSGGHGLISIALHEMQVHIIAQCIDSLKLFKIGASWGGTHSLVALMQPAGSRPLGAWKPNQWIVRLHIGLEPMQAIMADLHQAFKLLDQLSSASQQAREKKAA